MLQKWNVEFSKFGFSSFSNSYAKTQISNATFQASFENVEELRSFVATMRSNQLRVIENGFSWKLTPGCTKCLESFDEKASTKYKLLVPAGTFGIYLVPHSYQSYRLLPGAYLKATNNCQKLNPCQHRNDFPVIICYLSNVKVYHFDRTDSGVLQLVWLQLKGLFLFWWRFRSKMGK